MNIKIGYRELGHSNYTSTENFTGTMDEALAHAKAVIGATSGGTIYKVSSKASVASVKTNQIAELREA